MSEVSWVNKSTLVVNAVVVIGVVYGFGTLQSDYQNTKSQVATLQSKYEAFSEALRNSKGPKGDPGLKGDIGPKGETGPKGELGNLPLNIVVAFNLPRCPAGWTSYEKAEGRFLLGSSSVKQDSLPSEGASTFDMINSTSVPTLLTENDDRLPLLQRNSTYKATIRDGTRAYTLYPPFTQIRFCEKRA